MVDTQLIAHDREVYDIAWGGVGVFASVSADGSVRVFDLRRAAGWSQQDPLTFTPCTLTLNLNTSRSCHTAYHARASELHHVLKRRQARYQPTGCPMQGVAGACCMCGCAPCYTGI